jgi:inner membrane protein
MEPVTHVLTGACLARAGLNRKAAYTTLTMAVAAEFPDIDTLWGLRGPVEGFQHHRGITHTLLGIPFEAALLVALVYGLHRWRVARAPGTRPLTQAPPRWGLLYGFALIALLSHLLLDFTNNYGLRPFFPFNPRWYAGSIVYIFDPWLFGVLLLALGLPSIFRLVSAEVGARRESFRGRGMAQAALLVVLCYYGGRTFEHAQAVRLAEAQSLEQPGAGAAPAADQNTDAAPPPAPLPVYLQAQRVLANPDPLSVFRWYTVTDFGPVYQLGTADTLRHTFVAADNTQPKPNSADPAIAAAERSPMGRVYIDWSPMPFITAMRPSDPSLDVKTYVTFRDPRFMGDAPLLHARGSTPLTATVALDAQDHVLRQTMDGSAGSDDGEGR